jgi:spore germination cell wall hydrolase CwlJ-like protein
VQPVLIVIVLLSTALMTYEADLPTSSLYVERFFKAPISTTTKDQRCLIQALYYEAGNQPDLGKEAVALVILNRVGSPGYPNTICGVVQQITRIADRRVCQFSFWCEPRPNPQKKTWEQSKKIAQRVLTNYWNRVILTQYDNAMYFHAAYVLPEWSRRKKFLGRIGDHLFYAEAS